MYPLLYPSQVGVGFSGCHPRSSQIGVDLNQKTPIGVDLPIPALFTSFADFEVLVAARKGVQSPENTKRNGVAVARCWVMQS